MRVRLEICLSLAAAVAGCGNDSRQSFTAQVHTARVATTRIAWYERGQGPPLVMLTGTGSTMAEWDPALLRMLARAHRLILFDYPGRRAVRALARELIRLARRHHRRPDEGDRRTQGRCPGLVDGRLRRSAAGRRSSPAGLPSDLGRDQSRRQSDRARLTQGSGHRQRAQPVRQGHSARALPARPPGRGPPVPAPPRARQPKR